MSEEQQQQPKISPGDRVKPWQFQKGQSGNPNGRPPGKSLKERAKAMLNAMTEEEEQAFLHGLDKRVVWEMAEGKPKQDVEHQGAITISHVLDSLEHERSAPIEQGMADEPPVQNQEQETGASPIQAEQSPSPLQPEQVVSQPDLEISPVGIHNG